MDYLKSTLLKQRRTKIIATLGPATTDPATIERLIESGVDIFRLNMSHGDHATHREAYARVRAAAERMGQPTAILADLCGPKIRVGRFAGGANGLAEGERVTIRVRDVLGGPGLIPSQYEALARDVRPGDRILLDDGLLELRVEAVEGTEVVCTVLHGGILRDNKGMNLPGVNLSAPALTAKDRVDTRFVLELGVDFIALSFVRRASEIEELKALIEPAGRVVRVVAKIEMPQALEAIEEILDASDAIMVARGDLGVELPPEMVPIAQIHLLAQARAKGRPAIVATQMLESMVKNPRPTRAEVSDVAQAVFSGTDAVMLSAETATGAYPLMAVAMMNRVARQVEGYQWDNGAFGSLTAPATSLPPIPLDLAAARAIAQISRDLWVRAIVVVSRSGTTAGVVAAARPAAPVIAVTRNIVTYRQMNLLWGVLPILVTSDDLAHPGALARRLASELGLAKPGQFILMVAGFHPDLAESEPATTVLRV